MAVGSVGPQIEEAVEVDPLVERLAKEDDALPEDSKTTAVVETVEGKLSDVLAEGTAPAASQAEAIEQDPTLQRFKADYDKLPADLKVKCPWGVGKARLLANGGQKLKAAQELEQGGILFGVDKGGKLLFADKGDEPIMKGMDYYETRARVRFKHDRLDRSGKMELDESNQRISTGYEMFPWVGAYGKSDEILQYESCMGKPFVKSTNGAEWRSSWLESGEDPSLPGAIGYLPYNGYTIVGANIPQDRNPDRGVRRLLRV